ncbi:pyrimidine/purine nucleoside phosphorylase [Pedobacter sp. MC2016-15]|uniref:pyrimidine/purine nucleoside phosphorylase n=1 Tax=Pedobacter sp. MC2016-15 TaxID=2994473 RepID=UPI002247B794|nr:pyrimidine/purine nucleoside phosphorylase [Pedobacter sp. MC2016-15]MCX2480753.1 pyrimidine/purine nucleoside phosphorylase [Pedobacter sp. MC2016-15]
MSNSIQLSEEEETVSHNVYFAGKVQSLGLETERGSATVGVMKKGNYTFSTSSPEKMVIITGILGVKLEESSFKKYKAGEEFDVPSGVSFDVSCDDDVAYLCYYG